MVPSVELLPLCTRQVFSLVKNKGWLEKFLQNIFYFLKTLFKSFFGCKIMSMKSTFLWKFLWKKSAGFSIRPVFRGGQPPNALDIQSTTTIMRVIAPLKIPFLFFFLCVLSCSSFLDRTEEKALLTAPRQVRERERQGSVWSDMTIRARKISSTWV